MDWFERITGFLETGYLETQNRLQVENGFLLNEADGRSFAIGSLELISLNELRLRSKALSVPGRLSLRTVEDDVGRLHAMPENTGALFQVASQFNLLEMVGPSVTPEHGVSIYATDQTQGPACAIAAGAGTIWRNYLVPVGEQIGQNADRQLNCLADFGASIAQSLKVQVKSLWQMKNGYVLVNHECLAQIEAYLAELNETDSDALRGLLRVGLHRNVEVTMPGTKPGTLVSQIYCSALPVSYSGISATKWSHFAKIILEAAYEATLLAAIVNAANGGSRRLFLTRIGGGAFGNDDEWINDAILRALHCCKDQGIEVNMVSYGPPDHMIHRVETDWQSAQR